MKPSKKGVGIEKSGDGLHPNELYRIKPSDKKSYHGFRNKDNPMANYETIHEAAAHGDLADVKRHLQKGSDVNARDDEAWTPLMLAACNGHLDVVEFLKQHGAK